MRRRTIEAWTVHSDELLRRATACTGDPVLAQDAVQETFLRLFLALLQGGEIACERAWLHRSMRNLIIDWQRHASAHPLVSLEERGESRYFIAPAHAPERQLWRRKARTVLARREWQCFQLRASGLEYREIASALEIRKGTVGALLHRATRKLQHMFAQQEHLA